MIVYTAALPNKQCQDYIDSVYPSMRYMVSPFCIRSFGKNRHHIVKRGYAVDNGAYGYFTRGQEFDTEAFLSVLDDWATDADWVVIPDKVGDWNTTRDMLDDWVPILEKYNRPLLFVVQDGCEVNDYEDVHSLLRRPDMHGIFVGGTTDWKLDHMSRLSEICRSYGKVVHVGRVNSGKRVRLCHGAKVTSVDGSGMSRFIATTRVVCDTIVELNKQIVLF